MKPVSALLVVLMLSACFPGDGAVLPTAPTPPDERTAPPTVPPAPTSSATSVWVMVIGTSGACIDGAAVEIVSGQGLGQKLVQQADCDYWAYGGGVTFHGLEARVELTLRASAPAYVAEDKLLAPKAGGIGPVYFLLQPSK